MEMIDIKKKQDVEAAKTRLEETRQKLAETLTRLSKAETDFQESKIQCSRKSKNLKRIEGTQFFKMSRLNADIKNFESLLQTRLEEVNELRKTNAELVAELKKNQEEDVNMDVEFQKKYEELEGKINAGYLEVQNERDAEVVMEVGMGSLRSEGTVSFVDGYLHNVLKRRKEKSNELHVGLKSETLALDEALKDIEIKISEKAEELSGLRNVNDQLNKEVTEMNHNKAPVDYD